MFCSVSPNFTNSVSQASQRRVSQGSTNTFFSQFYVCFARFARFRKNKFARFRNSQFRKNSQIGFRFASLARFSHWAVCWWKLTHCHLKMKVQAGAYTVTVTQSISKKGSAMLSAYMIYMQNMQLHRLVHILHIFCIYSTFHFAFCVSWIFLHTLCMLVHVRDIYSHFLCTTAYWLHYIYILYEPISA